MQTAIVLALLGALFLALRDIFSRLAMRGIDPLLGTAATAVAGQIFLGIFSAWNGDFRDPWPGLGWPLFFMAMAGILRITAGRSLLFTAIKFAGAARASSLSATNVLFAIVMGPLFLKESVTLPLFLGALFIVTGCILIARSQVRGGSTEGDNRFALGMTLALAASLAIASSSIFARAGVISFTSPILANFYANAAALLIYLPLVFQRPLRSVLTWPGRTWIFIALIGFVASVGTTLALTALSQAPVVLVQPIIQVRPLFVILISWLFLQAHERVNWRVVIGGASVVAGTAFLIVQQ